jgi:hypothetical protein
MLDTKLPRTVFSVAIRDISNMDTQCAEPMKTHCTGIKLHISSMEKEEDGQLYTLALLLLAR